MTLISTSARGSGGSLPSGGTTGQSLVKRSAADSDTSWQSRPLDVFSIADYGAATASSDNTAAIQAAIAAANANGGGQVYVPVGTFVCTGQLSIPGGVAAGQVVISIRGQSPGIGMANIEASSPTAGSVLDLKYSGTGGKINALYEGIFVLENIRVGCSDSTKDTTPLVYLTMPQPRFDGVVFFGNSTHTLTACLQDAIVFGGTNAAHTENDLSSAFSGYGGFVRRCAFWGIRRHVFMQNWCNGVVVSDNITDRSTCGSAEANSAPYVIDTGSNDGSHYAMGNVFANNTIEIENYNYGFRFKNGAIRNTIRGNGYWDPSAGTLGLAYVEESTGCVGNWLRFDGYSHASYQSIGGVTLGGGSNMVEKVGTQSPSTLFEYKPASWQMFFNGNTTGAQSLIYDATIDGPMLAGNSGVGIRSAGRNQKAGLYVGSGSPNSVVSASPGSLYFNVAGGAGTSLYVKESGSGTNTGWVAYGASGALTSSTAYLSADVAMTTGGTFYDGPSLSLAAGTWLVSGQVELLASTTAVRVFTAKLWDGTTAVSKSDFATFGTAQAPQIPMAIPPTILTPGTTTTYKISATSTVNADTIKGTAPSNLNSFLTAVKIA